MIPTTKTTVTFKPQDKLLIGVNTLADAVTTTLGPRGRNVAIAHFTPDGHVYERTVVHDGVTVAKSIDLEDEVENMGAQLLKQAAQKQVQDVGDGTTVAVLLAQSLLKEINVLVAAGVNPMELRSKVEDQVKLVIAEITRLSIPVTTFDQKKYIATVSAEDDTLGELVAKIIEEMGVDGLVMVEESKNNGTTVEKQEGMQLDKGYLNPFFITNPDRMEAVLENPLILVTDRDIQNFEPLKGILDTCSKNGQPLVIISPSMGMDALGALAFNKQRGTLTSLAIQAPSFGNNQKGILGDVAIFTGAKFITADAGMTLDTVKMEDLGTCEYISCTATETLMSGGSGNAKDISDRIDGIKLQIDKTDSDFDKEKLKERLAKLTSGVAVIKVGGSTEVEMLERLERVKDAVAATKAAITGGIVPGGEVIYLQARKVLAESDLLFPVLYQPFKKLVTNAGFNDGQLYERLISPTGIVVDFKDKKKAGDAYIDNAGVDVKDGEIKNMVKIGIIDPTLVPINALTNAVSVAVQISTTGAVVTPKLNELSMSKLSQ